MILQRVGAMVSRRPETGEEERDSLECRAETISAAFTCAQDHKHHFKGLKDKGLDSMCQSEWTNLWHCDQKKGIR